MLIDSPEPRLCVASEAVPAAAESNVLCSQLWLSSSVTDPIGSSPNTPPVGATPNVLTLVFDDPLVFSLETELLVPSLADCEVDTHEFRVRGKIWRKVITAWLLAAIWTL